MRIHIPELLKTCGFDGTLYWGKRLVRALPQPGAFKSHSVVMNWQEPTHIRMELRAGLSGKTLQNKELANYPLHLQSETFFDFKVETTTDGGSEGEKSKSGSAKGSASGGGRKMAKKKDDALSSFFSRADNEKIPSQARLTKGVVMGMEIGKDALESVFTLFCQQIAATRVLATDLLAAAGKAITRYTPPAFMAPRGDEDKVYKYNREKNEVMFGVVPT